MSNKTTDRFILTDCDLTFSEKEIQDFKFLWNEGHTLEDIWKYLRRKDWQRTYDEVCLLLFELSRTGEVEKRKNGIW
ncbi:hypothetical protein H1D32_13240 [Anaerobacillus sp. CMMVII]|uniref:hypothetical protein n=1 Tax=Anaerobacillus sp. CMMVII TaxID=2755588 RepID=UPI0021B818A9|nr:hypothetical protein [Anaerobacillus sp. CMMVII]MCT8138621.1 hypothetical protein [Anaerobacillus sp. CMMVII]